MRRRIRRGVTATLRAMTRYDCHQVSQATVLRILRCRGLVAEAALHQRERRKLAEKRRAAFLTPPTGANQVWQFDFSEFETAAGGTWRFAGAGSGIECHGARHHRAPPAPTALPDRPLLLSLLVVTSLEG